MTHIETLKLALEYVESVPDDRYNAEHIDPEALVTALRQVIAEAEQAQPVVHCEAGPEFCKQCSKESKPTYGSEEVRKLREVIESQARIIELMEREQGCPPFWPVVQHLLDEYGLQLIDIVAAYKQATEQAPPPRQPLTDEQVRDGGRKADPGMEDLCNWSFKQGVRFAEAAHNITGEK